MNLAELCLKYIKDKSYWNPNCLSLDSVQLINFVRTEVFKESLTSQIFVLDLPKKTHSFKTDDLFSAMINDGITPVIVSETENDWRVAMLLIDAPAIMKPSSEKEEQMIKSLELDKLERVDLEISYHKEKVGTVTLFKGFAGNDLKSLKQTLPAQYIWHDVHKKT